jgi:SAM-dependent methyltransferase
MRLKAAETCGVAAQTPALLKCTACASVTMEPVPDNPQLASFYTHYHATDDFVAKAHKKVFRAFKRLLPLRLKAGRGRFLEVGASIGTASEAARRLGYEATAQEIDAEAVAIGREMYPDVTFVEGFVSDVDAPETFSLIYCAEVIEHVSDPAAFVAELYALLKPGGWLYLTTPDAGHAKRPEPFINWSSVKPPEHVVLFTKVGLTALFMQAGFNQPSFAHYRKPGIRMTVQKPA